MGRIVVSLLLLLVVLAPHAEEITLTNWNLLNYPGSTGLARAPYMRTVLASIRTDLLVVQEIDTQSGVTHFMTNVLEVMEPGVWSAAQFHDGYDSDRALFYRTGSVEVLAYGWLETDLRTIDWWQLRLPGTGNEFRLYTLHLKASQGSSEELQRLAECQVLRTALDALDPQLPFVVTGDHNLYTAAEPAYQWLTAPGPGELFDPIEQEGDWHDNPAYAGIHTQSTRTVAFGGGATGGLDDRFDLMLVSEELLDQSALEIRPETYTAYGNDGAHFNQSIINNGNSAVPADVAEALYQSSDHLPVFAVLRGEASAPSSLAGDPAAPLRLCSGPNPSLTPARLRFTLANETLIDLTLLDASGRAVATLARGPQHPGIFEYAWDGRDAAGRPVAAGVYYARLVAGAQTSVTRIVRIR